MPATATYSPKPTIDDEGMPMCTAQCPAFVRDVMASFVTDRGICCITKRRVSADSDSDCRPALIEMSRKLREFPSPTGKAQA